MHLLSTELTVAISLSHYILMGISVLTDTSIYERFIACLQSALEAVTATHQLEAAVDTFSWCLRPLLRQGCLQPLGQDPEADKVAPWPLQFYGICDSMASPTGSRQEPGQAEMLDPLS